MSPHRKISREEILIQLQRFASENGRPPKRLEPGLESLANAARKEFGSWEYALRIAGLQTYKVWRRRRTVGGEIHRLLDRNPMTVAEIRQELARSPISASKPQSMSSTSILNVAKQSSDIKSIGPRRTKIYYLEGQETLAQTRLEAIMSDIPQLEEEIFYHLRQPVARAQIEKLVFGDKPTTHKSEKVSLYLKELELAGLIYRVRFIGGRGHGRGRKFTSYELFGDLATKTLYCRFDCPNEVAQLIIGSIPSTESCDKDSKIMIASRRSHLLRRMLPENAYRIVESKLWETFDRW